METRKINKETVIDNNKVYRKIWTFHTQELMDLYINEMCGQISDGLFENSDNTNWVWEGNIIFRLGDKTEFVYQGCKFKKKLNYPITNEFIDNVADRIYTENGFEYGDRKSVRAAWKEINEAIKNWRCMTDEEYDMYVTKPLKKLELQRNLEKQEFMNELRKSTIVNWYDDNKDYKRYGNIVINSKTLFYNFCVADYKTQKLNVWIKYCI